MMKHHPIHVRKPDHASIGRAPLSAEAWQQILDAVAAIDPNASVYDPSNPNTISLRVDGDDEFIEAIADGMGNRGAIEQDSAASQPLLIKGGFGKLDAMQFDGSDLLRTSSEEFSDISLPLTRVQVLRNISSVSFARIWNGLPSTSERVQLRIDGSEWRIFNGTALQTSVNVGTNPHVITTIFDNSDQSEIRIDSKSVIKGDAGTLSSHGGNAVGRRGDNAGGGWNGLMGPLIIFSGKDESAIESLEDLLHTLSGIDKDEA